MTDRTRLFRLFVSSTFSDMVHERRILHERVFPALEALCASRGSRFHPIDLRWGVNEDSQRDHRTMSICLGEIDRCQRLSPAPNFLVLLGDRYGWEPLPTDISLAEFDRLLGHASAAQRAVLDRWYRRDDNAVPAAVRLIPLDADDHGAWEQTEQELRQALRSLVNLAQLDAKARAKYFQSATHQEITRGLLCAERHPSAICEPAQHVLACIRRIDGLPVGPHAFADFNGEALEALKREVRARLDGTADQPPSVMDYTATWNAGLQDIAVDHEDAFAARIIAHFTRIISAELDAIEVIESQDAESRAHREFRDARVALFAGRASELHAVAALVASPDRLPVFVVGAGGSGKTSLVAAATRLLEVRPGILALRFVGATPRSTRVVSLIRDLAADVAFALGDDRPIPEAGPGLAAHLASLLGRASATRPICLAIDAIDQLDDGNSLLTDWLPAALPPHTHVLISTTPAVSQIANRGTHFTLEPMSLNDAGTLLDGWLGDAGRRLTVPQRAAVLDAFTESPSPLYLKLVFERAKSWRSWDEIPPLPRTVAAMVDAIFAAVERDHDPRRGATVAPLVATTLGLLGSARYGLTDADVVGSLACDHEFIAAFRSLSFHPTNDDRLPDIVWSRLFLDLAPYLMERESNGAAVLAFHHRLIGDAVRARYASTERGRHYHALLAGHFVDQPTYLDDNRALPNYRKAGELAYQLQQSGEWEALSALLSDFDVLMATCQAGLVTQLLADFDAAMRAMDAPSRLRIAPWAAFVSGQAHLLLRGSRNWGSDRIFEQVAAEQEVGGLVAEAAAAWSRRRAAQLPLLRALSSPKPPVSRALEGHSGPVAHADVLRDGRLLSWAADDAASTDYSVRVWNLDTHTCEAVFTEHTGPVCGALELPDGRIVSWCRSTEAEARLHEGPVFWDASTGQRLRMLDGHEGPVHGVMLDSSNRLITWSDDGCLRLWEGAQWESCRRLVAHRRAVERVIELEDGRLLSSSRDERCLWDPVTGELLAQWKRRSQIAPWRDQLVVSLLKTRRRRDVFCIEDLSKCSVRAVIDPLLFPDRLETELFSKYYGGTSRGSMFRICPLDADTALTWHASQVSNARIWSLATGECIGLLAEDGRNFRHVALLPGRRIATAGNRIGGKAELAIWDTHSGERLFRLPVSRSEINGISVLSDGLLLAWSEDGTLGLWNPENRRIVSTLDGHAGPVTGAQELPDGRLVSWSADRAIRVWNAEAVRPREGATARAPRGRTSGPADEDPTIAGAVSIGRGVFATRAGHKQVYLWDGRSGSCVAHGRLPKRFRIEGFQGLSDGNIAAWSSDHRIALIDGRSGELLREFTGQSWIRYVKLLPQGFLLAGGMYGDYSCWHVDSAKRVEEPKDVLLEAGLPCLGEDVFEGTITDRWSKGQRATDERLAIDAGQGQLLIPKGSQLTMWRADGTEAWSVRRLGGIGGLIIQPDGDVFTWPWKVSARSSPPEILHRQTGRPRETLPSFGPYVFHVEPIGDDRFLVCSLKDDESSRYAPLTHTLTLWGRTGRVIDQMSPGTAFEEAPALWRHWARVVGEGTAELAVFAVGARVLAVAGSSTPIVWHGDGDWTLDAVTAEGIVMLHQGSRPTFLRLQSGA